MRGFPGDDGTIITCRSGELLFAVNRIEGPRSESDSIVSFGHQSIPNQYHPFRGFTITPVWSVMESLSCQCSRRVCVEILIVSSASVTSQSSSKSIASGRITITPVQSVMESLSFVYTPGVLVILRAAATVSFVIIQRTWDHTYQCSS